MAAADKSSKVYIRGKRMLLCQNIPLTLQEKASHTNSDRHFLEEDAVVMMGNDKIEVIMKGTSTCTLAIVKRPMAMQRRNSVFTRE